jgi:alanine-glyoxylate transaminase/serine-glyoxylate transaminase/serine-pyruvate transaminase
VRGASVITMRSAGGDGPRLRAWCERVAGQTLGIGLAFPDQHQASLFRIGHMGHLNPPMILGTLATIESALAALGIAHRPGGATAAARAIAADLGEPADTANPLEKAVDGS